MILFLEHVAFAARQSGAGIGRATAYRLPCGQYGAIRTGFLCKLDPRFQSSHPPPSEHATPCGKLQAVGGGYPTLASVNWGFCKLELLKWTA